MHDDFSWILLWIKCQWRVHSRETWGHWDFNSQMLHCICNLLPFTAQVLAASADNGWNWTGYAEHEIHPDWNNFTTPKSTSRPCLSWPVLLVARARPSDPLQRCELCFKSLHKNSAWKCCIKFALIHHSSKGRGFLWESLVQPLLWWRIPEETTSIHDFSNINHQRLKLCLFWKWIHSTWVAWIPFQSKKLPSASNPITQSTLDHAKVVVLKPTDRSPQDWFRFPLITTKFQLQASLVKYSLQYQSKSKMFFSLPTLVKHHLYCAPSPKGGACQRFTERGLNVFAVKSRLPAKSPGFCCFQLSLGKSETAQWLSWLLNSCIVVTSIPRTSSFLSVETVFWTHRRMCLLDFLCNVAASVYREIALFFDSNVHQPPAWKLWIKINSSRLKLLKTRATIGELPINYHIVLFRRWRFVGVSRIYVKHLIITFTDELSLSCNTQIRCKVEPKLEDSFKADIKKKRKKRNVFIAKFGWKMCHCYLVQRMFVFIQ